MLYTIIEKETGKELYAKFDNIVEDWQVAIEELRTIEMENPYFNFETREFYEHPTT
jgi:hypothetical protein